MADESVQKKPGSEAGEPGKKQLLKRVGIGAVLIILLIGGLGVFDAYNRPSPGPVTRIEPPPATPIAPTAPAVQPTPAPPPPAEPEKSAAPEPRTKLPEPLTAAAGKSPATEAKPVPAAPAKEPKSPPAKAEDRSQPTATPEPASVAAKPAAAPGGRYMLQVGVFTHPDNAKQLLAKLSAAGISAQAETRVQVGPFATREEAEVAIRKLKTLGVESTLLIPVKRP